MAEDEKVHPLVSSLLDQEFVPRAAGEVFSYDREEMMRLRNAPLSVTRPDNLSTDFDGLDFVILAFFLYSVKTANFLLLNG